MSPERNYNSYVQRMHTRRGLPPDPCIRCYAGHTDTFFVVFGDIEWQAGALAAVTGIDEDEAIGTSEVMRAENGAKPDERIPSFIRICRTCMAQSRVSVPLYTTDQLQLIVGEDMEFDGIVQTDEHTRRALGQ